MVVGTCARDLRQWPSNCGRRNKPSGNFNGLGDHYSRAQRTRVCNIADERHICTTFSTHITSSMTFPLTQDDLWHAIESIGSEYGVADKIAPPVIAKLIELRFVDLNPTGLPRLADKGERAL